MTLILPAEFASSAYRLLICSFVISNLKCTEILIRVSTQIVAQEKGGKNKKNIV